MTSNPAIIQEGKLPINVKQSIVRHLSLGLYRNFAISIKELISNAYDAGATEVKIKLDLKKNRIIVRDNGDGMGLIDLEKKYLTIGELTNPSEAANELGRMRIGTFGIGFLAPLPYCKYMIVVTKQRGNTSSIEARVNAENFFKKGSWNISEEKVNYKIYNSDLPVKEGETMIILEEIKSHISEELSIKKSRGKTKLDHYGGFEKFKWMLCQYAPIQYSPKRKDLRNFFEVRGLKPMRLWLDGEEVFRNVPEGVTILEKGEKKFNEISLKYVIMTPFDPIYPEEARGLQLRLRDVAVGLPRDFDVTKLGRVLGKLNFLCGEITIKEGLDSALMVTRDNLNYTQEVSDIYKFFQSKLTKWNSQLYNWVNEDRKLYESLGELKNDSYLVKNLMKAGLLHFAKKRLRFPKAPIVTTRKYGLAYTARRIYEALKSARVKRYEILLNRGKIPKNRPPLLIDHRKKTITVYENHEKFSEKIEFNGKRYEVGYGKWELHDNFYPICKLINNNKTVIYNKSHPIFKSKLSDNLIKQLSLGILVLLQKRKDKDALGIKLSQLLLDTFSK